MQLDDADTRPKRNKKSLHEQDSLLLLNIGFQRLGPQTPTRALTLDHIFAPKLVNFWRHHRCWSYETDVMRAEQTSQRPHKSAVLCSLIDRLRRVSQCRRQSLITGLPDAVNHALAVFIAESRQWNYCVNSRGFYTCCGRGWACAVRTHFSFLNQLGAKMKRNYVL